MKHQQDFDLFGAVTAQTQCGHCPKVVLLTDATVSTYEITPYLTEVEHFCSPNCAQENWETFHARD